MGRLRAELEADAANRRFGQGWISGVSSLLLAIAGVGAVLCLRYPDVLTVPDARQMYNVTWIRLILHVGLIAALFLGVLSVVLRENRTLGFTAIGLTLLAAALGGSRAQDQLDLDSNLYLGLDWFLLNVIFTGVVFIPLERVFGLKEQPIFRREWHEDIFYFLVSSLFVQGLTFLSLAPSLAILKHTEWSGFRAWVGSQPLVLQFFEIMFLTDLVQYWVHRAFHRWPFLWRFHSVHHSSQTMDWMAGARMHVFEIIFLRGSTVIPMYVLGFSPPALYGYIFFVFLFSTFVHANIRNNLALLGPWFVTPRFHHWHHGIEREAIDVNFAVHFPLLDRLFGTYYLPEGRWPSGYGINQHPVPSGYVRQFVYPFVRERRVTPSDATGVEPYQTAPASSLSSQLPQTEADSPS
jgi:sterol desaturase/sphingolipid hydroxylase (fatty acid hydroxylase superfamily)